MRLKPSNCEHPENPEHRSRERYRRALATTLTSGASRAIALVTMVVSVPLTIRYLGAERYGLWMTISSGIAMLTFADLGIGNGLLNAVAESDGKDDHDGAREYVASAFFMLLTIAVTILTAFAAAYRFVPWGRLLNVRTPIAVGEVGPAVAVCVVCFCCNLPLGIVTRIQSGYQQGFRADLWVGVGNVAGLVGLLTAARLRAGLPWLVLALTGTTVAGTFVNGCVLFRRHRWLLPEWSKANKARTLRLLGLGVSFLLLQTSLAITNGADNLIAAHALGASGVASYAVTLRMFSILPMALVMALNPLWPAYGEAIARGEIRWATATLWKSLLIVAVSTAVLGGCLAAFGERILKLWTHDQIHASPWLLSGMALWMVLSTSANAVSIFLNAANLVMAQAYSAVALCGLATFGKIALVGRAGLPAIIWSTDAAYLVCVWLPILIFVPRYLSSLEKLRSASQDLLVLAEAKAMAAAAASRSEA